MQVTIFDRLGEVPFYNEDIDGLLSPNSGTAFLSPENDCARSIPKQNASCSVFPVQNARKRLGSDYQNILSLAEADKIISNVHSKYETRTNRLDIES